MVERSLLLELRGEHMHRLVGLLLLRDKLDSLHVGLILERWLLYGLLHRLLHHLNRLGLKNLNLLRLHHLLRLNHLLWLQLHHLWLVLRRLQLNLNQLGLI